MNTQIKVNTLTLQDELVVQRTELFGSVYEQVMNLREAHIREALEALGWTPPPVGGKAR